MTWVTWLLFESPPALAATLGTVLFMLLVHWRRGGRPRALLIGLGGTTVLIVVQALVVTRREHAGRTLRRIEADLLHGRADALAAEMSADFLAGTMDRREFLLYVRRMLDRVAIRWLERTGLRLTAAERDRFVVSAAYLAEIRREQYQSVSRSRWSLTFDRTPTGWKIGRIEPESIAGIASPNWESLERR